MAAEQNLLRRVRDAIVLLRFDPDKGLEISETETETYRDEVLELFEKGGPFWIEEEE